MPTTRSSSWALSLVAVMGMAACGGGDDAPSGAATGTGGAASGGAATGGANAMAGQAGGAGTSSGGKGGGGASGKSGAGGASSGAAGKSGASGASSGAPGQGGAAGKGGAGGGAGKAGSATGGTNAAGAGTAGTGAGGTGAGAGGTGSGGTGTGGIGAAGAGAAGASAAGTGGSSTAACPGLTTGPTGHLTAQSLTAGGMKRTYSMDVPAPLDPARKYPLVFVLHGDGGDGEGIRAGYGFSAIAGSEAIFVYPDALAPDKSWNVDTPPPGNVDIAFIDGLIAQVGQDYCVDSQRRFAAGMSRGGFFANRLGCDRGDQLRAIAPHSGSIYATGNDGYDADGYVKCTTDGPAVIQFHGDADATVPVKDGEYARDQWVHESQCTQTTAPYAPSPCVAYGGCEAAHPVVWCEIPGLGHAIWKSAPQATWDFFHGLP